ncbi:hypothetical protein PCO82_12235 [Pectobacteriaceae bacterium CE90]|nr:hypothetical protein PCO82_12235 [Pectobacteriaceae bacterium CE90]
MKLNRALKKNNPALHQGCPAALIKSAAKWPEVPGGVFDRDRRSGGDFGYQSLFLSHTERYSRLKATLPTHHSLRFF